MDAGVTYRVFMFLMALLDMMTSWTAFLKDLQNHREKEK